MSNLQNLQPRSKVKPKRRINTSMTLCEREQMKKIDNNYVALVFKEKLTKCLQSIMKNLGSMNKARKKIRKNFNEI